jgi:hypothetical protein
LITVQFSRIDTVQNTLLTIAGTKLFARGAARNGAVMLTLLWSASCE